jgi:arginyl-tRNA synthetase
MIYEELAEVVRLAVKNQYQLDVETPKIERPERGFGDFTTNVAFRLAGQLKLPPQRVAEELAAGLVGGLVERAEAAGAGFINLWLSNEYWCARLAEFNTGYGASEFGAGRKLQVEFISANPTGPLTIGNARGGFIGDVLTRVLKRVGYDARSEYYFNDAGTQVGKLLESVKMEAGIVPETEERQYRGDYIKALAEKFADDLKTKSDDELKPLLTGEVVATYIKPAVAKMGIEFDVWFNETEIINDGTFDKVMAKLKDLGLIFERDGAVWLKTADLGDERGERVIVKSNGDPTYLAPDIAYHENIFGKRGFDGAIKVLGPDHIAQFPSVYAAVHALHPDKEFKMVSYQWLRVIRDGVEVKVSKRLGQFITISDLIDQVGMPIARFLTLMRSADSHMDFDLDLAREQSAKNPYYYVMYSYARANSVLEKAAEAGLKAAAGEFKLNEPQRELVMLANSLPTLLEEMAVSYEVHKLIFFGLEMSKLFTEYYESTRIIGLPKEQAEKELFFVARFIDVMDVYWQLLGIEPQKQMR